MKYEIVSDLHLEFGSIEIKNAGADVLVLSGDIVAADIVGRPDPTEIIRVLNCQKKFLMKQK